MPTSAHEPVGVIRPTACERRPVAVIYTHSLLGGSMTFIKSHADALRNYASVFAGAHRESGLAITERPAYVVNENTPLGFVREALFRHWGWAPTLVKSLRAHEPAIVHAHFGTSGPAGLALAESLGVPLVVTFHGFDATISETAALKSQRGRELLRGKARLISGTGAFIAVSGYIRQRLINQDFPEKKILLIRNGIDLESFHVSNVEKKEPIILFVGRFVEKKGARYLIEAGRILKEQGIHFELVLIGTGPLEQELKRAATDAGIPCQFTGFLKPEDVKHWLDRALVVAVPSVTADNGDSEGLPTILLEAQATGVPIVATRHSGIPEGVEEGVTAELVAEKDAFGLASMLRSFLESPAKSQAFAKASRRFVEEQFDLRTQIEQLENLYDDLRARHRAK